MQLSYLALQPEPQQIGHRPKLLTILWVNAQMSTVLIPAQVPSRLCYQIRVVHLQSVHEVESQRLPVAIHKIYMELFVICLLFFHR